jgi:hypothetical protein
VSVILTLFQKWGCDNAGKNVVDDVLLDGDFGMNAIVNGLKWKLGLPPHQLGPFNFKMDNFSYNKPLGIIPNIQNLIHGIPYIITFIVMNNKAIDPT